MEYRDVSNDDDGEQPIDVGNPEDEEIVKFRSVFNLLDTEQTGFISIERFVQVATEYFGHSVDDNSSLEQVLLLASPDTSQRHTIVRQYYIY